MPFDGSGNFNRVMNWVSDALANIKIVATRHDSEDDNFAAGLSQCITKDGQTQPTANIPMNGKKLINLAAPTTGTDATNKTYVDTADGLLAPKASPTFTGKVTLPTGAAGSAPLSFPNATAAPTTPANGDIWPDATNGALKHRLAGVTYTYGRLEAAQTWTADQSFSTNIFVTGVQSTFGAANASGQVQLAGNAVEVGLNRTADGVSVVDLHGQVGTDYDARILRNTGANGRLDIINNGTGGINLNAGGLPSAFTYNSSPILVANVDNFAISAGWATGYVGDGSKSGGVTYTAPLTSGNMRLVQNGGNFTWAADADVTSKSYTQIVILQNTATAGTVTFSGWSAVTGDPLTTVNGALFMCSIIKHGGVKTINIQAL